MKTKAKLGLGAALLVLAAGCGSEVPSADNQALANAQESVDNGMIVDPEIPNAAVEANGAAAVEPGVEPAGANPPAAVKVAPAPPPKVPPKAKAEAPKAPPKPEPVPAPKEECTAEHRAAGHC